jgi:hypothetical protein
MKKSIFGALVVAAALPVAAQTANTPRADPQGPNKVQQSEKAAAGGKATPKDCAALQKARGKEGKIAKKKSTRKAAA